MGTYETTVWCNSNGSSNNKSQPAYACEKLGTGEMGVLAKSGGCRRAVMYCDTHGGSESGRDTLSCIVYILGGRVTLSAG